MKVHHALRVLFLVSTSGCVMQVAQSPTPSMTSTFVMLEKPSATPADDWPIYVTPFSSLAEIPVTVGQETFNELNNRGYSQKYLVEWTSEDLRITQDGRLEGTFLVECDGPMASYPDFRDVLFVQVVGVYIEPHFADLMEVPLSDAIAVTADTSDNQSAEFRVSSTFQTPALATGNDNLLPLQSVEITLTWVRAYQSGQGLYVQVFPGDSSRHPSQTAIGFDQEPQTLTGRFSYHSVISGDSLMGGSVIQPEGEFDYRVWLRDQVK